QKAAALTESLARNHGFIDGNKRSALLTLYLFLHRSGYELTASKGVVAMWKLAAGNDGSEKNALILANIEAEQMILNIVQNHLPYEELVKWFQERLQRRV